MYIYIYIFTHMYAYRHIARPYLSTGLMQAHTHRQISG